MNIRAGEHLNLIGQRFGQLTVIKELPHRINKFGKREYMWLCKCDCGNMIEECTHSLRQGCATRCTKCYRNSIGQESHGDCGTRLYGIWFAMKRRCYDENTKQYKEYGGRGIKVCDEWKNSYISFKKWAINNGYSDKLSIDRIDVNGNYEPSNCRWATAKEQARNKQNTIMCYYNGKIIPLVEASELLNIPRQSLYRWHKIWEQTEKKCNNEVYNINERVEKRTKTALTKP